MVKFRYNVVVYSENEFDKNKVLATLDSLQTQTGKYASGILCSVIMPIKAKYSNIEKATVKPKNLNIIYSDDSSDELRKCLTTANCEYVALVKAGDVFSQNAFSDVYACFDKVKGNCDAVGIRIESEEKQYLKYNSCFEFLAGKVFHLNEKYGVHPVNLNGLFIKCSVAISKVALQKKGFDEYRFLIDVLGRRNVFAAADSASYIILCPKENAKKSPDMFERTLDELNEIARYELFSNEFLPLFVQDIFANAIVETLNYSEDVVNVYHITHYDFESMWDKLQILLNTIDNGVIMGLSTIRFMKLFLLKEKYGQFCRFDLLYKDLKMVYQNTTTYNLSAFPIRFDLISIDKGKLFIEGVCHIPSCINFEKYSVKALVNGKITDTAAVERYSDRYYYNKIYLKEAGFKLEIPLSERIYEIRFADCVENNICLKNVYEFTNICQLGNEIAEDYYFKDDFIVNYSKNAIICRCVSKKEQRFWEDSLQFAIRCSEPSRANELIEIRNFYWENYQKKTNQIWLITDRPDRADDNGEAFFRYMAERKEENIDLYFVLSKNSASYEELSGIGNVIEPFSTEHKKLHLLSDYIISSQMAEAVYNPFNDDVKFFRGLFRSPKQVFLQHGVINNEHGGRFFSRYGRDFYGFVVSADEEYKYMLEPKFHYNENKIWLTGLPRWDRLYRDDKKIITIMPTWRKYLTTRMFDEEAGTKIWKVNDNFTDTKYFKFYNGIINNNELLDAAEKYGYTICFMPHVIFLKEADKFDKNDRAVIYDYEKSYREIYAESSLIVTDYSSAIFDFAYMRQPIVYCQFDKDEFYKGHSYTKGYFDHKRDGFGEVTHNEEGLVKVLIEYMSEDCRLKPKYRKRIDEFFSFNDKKCCERVYKKIHYLEKKGKDE